MTSRAKNWVSSDSQLSSRLIRLQLILRPHAQQLCSFSPSFPLHSFVVSSFPQCVYIFFSVSLSHTHWKRKEKDETILTLHSRIITFKLMLWQTAAWIQASDSLWAMGNAWEMEQGGRKTSPLLVGLVLLCLRRLCSGTSFVCSVGLMDHSEMTSHIILCSCLSLSFYRSIYLSVCLSLCLLCINIQHACWHTHIHLHTNACLLCV